MESKLHGLPPLKRFRLMQQQNNTPKKTNPKSPENTTTTPSCLPAKKRKESRDSPPVSTTYCLPAKKRIWAVHPFDLNIEYELSNDTTDKQEKIPPKVFENPPQTHTQEGENEDDDDGIVCAVCESTDGDPTDPIVLCDGCDLMVHTSCYGHPFTNGVPEGDWFCAQCLAKNSRQKSEKISCCLCPVSSGALKPTTDNKWAHLVCAIYVPEVFFVDSKNREGIDCSKVLRRRWNGKCYVCESKNGCVIDCSEPDCPLAFHVTCGLRNELCIEYRQHGNKKNNGGGHVVAAFCADHTHLWKKQEQTGKYKIVARDENKK